MSRKANGNLHYFINGLDQGVAASRLPSQAKKSHILDFLLGRSLSYVEDVLVWILFLGISLYVEDVLVRFGEWWICTG